MKNLWQLGTHGVRAAVCCALVGVGAAMALADETAPATPPKTDAPKLVVKKLRVDYTFNGAKKSKTVDENQTLTISNTGE